MTRAMLYFSYRWITPHQTAFIGGFFMSENMRGNMDQQLFAFFAFAISLLRTFTVVMLAWFTLRELDKRMGFVFKDWWEKADDKDKVYYLAARCVAVFLAFSICMA